MANIKRVILEDRDIPVLFFLWNFKVATTAALCAKFFDSPLEEKGYRRLLRLESGGFIKSISDQTGSHFVWSLDQKGFNVVRPHLPDLKQEGFKSEHIDHDLLASAFHLGKWFMEIPTGVRLVTEQQLRRFDFESYPEHIPRTDLHRPDGYWILQDGAESKVVALEVELSSQRTARYNEVFNFYDRYKNIFRVLWLVPSAQKANSLHAQFKTGTTSEIDYNDFVLMNDFQKRNWDAQIILGQEIGQRVTDLLSRKPSETPPLADSQWMLDKRKCPYKSKDLFAPKFCDFRV